MGQLQAKVFSGVVWRSIERLSMQFVSLGVSIVLARLITPEDFGTVAIASMFMAFLYSLVDSGFGDAIVRKTDLKEQDCNTAFLINLSVSIVLYALIFISAPWIARFYKTPVLGMVLRVASLSLVFDGLNGVQNAMLVRNMQFRKSFYINAGQVCIGGATGLAMALSGFGVWALVLSALVSGVFGIIVRWACVGWRPTRSLSVASARSLYSFGWKIYVSNLIRGVYSNLVGLVIGKVYAPAQLAYYNKGTHFPGLAIEPIDQATTTVFLPAFSKLQGNLSGFRVALRKSVSTVCMLVMPGMTILAFCMRPVILVLLGDKWANAIVFGQLACFSYSFLPLSSLNMQALKALGRSDVFLVLGIVRQLVAMLLLVATYKLGIVPMAFALLVVQTIFGTLLNTLSAARITGYTLSEQFRDILPAFGVCVGLSLCLAPIHIWIPNRFFQLPSFLLVGASCWFVIGLAFRPRSLIWALEGVIPFFERRAPKAAAYLCKILRSRS